MSKRDESEPTGETTATEKTGKRFTLTRTVVRPLNVRTHLRAGQMDPIDFENAPPPHVQG